MFTLRTWLQCMWSFLTGSVPVIRWTLWRCINSTWPSMSLCHCRVQWPKWSPTWTSSTCWRWVITSQSIYRGNWELNHAIFQIHTQCLIYSTLLFLLKICCQWPNSWICFYLEDSWRVSVKSSAFSGQGIDLSWRFSVFIVLIQIHCANTNYKLALYKYWTSTLDSENSQNPFTVCSFILLQFNPKTLFSLSLITLRNKKY